jgi:hypothetical protein
MASSFDRVLALESQENRLQWVPVSLRSNGGRGTPEFTDTLSDMVTTRLAIIAERRRLGVPVPWYAELPQYGWEG